LLIIKKAKASGDSRHTPITKAFHETPKRSAGIGGSRGFLFLPFCEPI
jgi:hypothetical protein